MNNVMKVVISITIALVAVIMSHRFLTSDETMSKSDKSVTVVEANALLVKHAEIYGKERIAKVREHVYVAVGFTVANMILLEGTDGIIIVDTTESAITARRIFNEFRKITQKPLKGVIVTHFHSDHLFGAHGLVKDAKDAGGDVRVFTHATTAFENLRFMTSSGIGYKRASRQFGMHLEPGSEQIDCGIGPRFPPKQNVVYSVPEATDTFQTEETYTLAGITFTLIHTPGETNDQITVWIPDWQVVLPADNIYQAFPNLYTIRGSPSRNCEAWVRSLDKVRHLRARYMVPSHTNPVEGEEEIFDIITHYRDAIQFVNDQTIRWMNAGLEVDEIVERVQLPPSLGSHPYLLPFYGTVAWSVRSVFGGQLGWFDGDPVNLFPLSKQKRAERFEEILATTVGSEPMSGAEKMIKKAQEGVKKSTENLKATGYVLEDDLQWSLELSINALKVTRPSSSLYNEAKKLAIIALKSLAISTINSNARNYYLTSAKELESGLAVELSAKSKANIMHGLKISEIMKQFPFRFIAESCDDKAIQTVIFTFPDIKESHSYTMRHCILEYTNEPSRIPKEFDAKVSMPSSVWKDILTKTRSPLGAYASGDLVLEGSMISFKRFMDLLERK